MNDTAPGNPATRRTVKLTDLVLDPALQCRAVMDEATIDAYAQVLAEGGTLPPIRAVEVDGRLLLVDGWHRFRAAERCHTVDLGGESRFTPKGDRTIEVDVEPGDRRAAQLAAVKANGDHGLPRSMADKRRAVRMLLGDAEWCKLSGRELGKLAGVSHTFVDERRAAYGVKAGTVLKDADIQRVDSEPPKAWRDLLSEASETYYKTAVEKIRVAAGPLDLVAAGALGEVGRKAQVLRRREFATEEWPWPEDVGHPSMGVNMANVEARCARLDTIPDLVKAVRAAHGILDDKQRDQLYTVIETAQQIKGARESYQVEGLRKQLAGRAAFVAQLDAIDARRKAAEDKRRSQSDQPYDVGPRIMGMKDPKEQATAVLSVGDDVFSYLSGPKLHPEVRDGAYRDRVTSGGREGPPCMRPSCKGWTYINRWKNCVCGVCETPQENWRKEARRALGDTAALLGHEGFGFTSRFGGIDGVVVDRAGVRLLQAIEDAGTGEGKAAVIAWLKKAPLGINTQALAFLKRTPVAFTQTPPAPPEGIPLQDGSRSRGWNLGWAAYQRDAAEGNRELEPEPDEDVLDEDCDDWNEGYLDAQAADAEKREKEGGG